MSRWWTWQQELCWESLCRIWDTEPGLYPISPYVAVKVPVFSFEKLINVDNHLGPEMKSTGEVLGIASTLREALYKGLIGAGYKLNNEVRNGVLITVRDTDKAEAIDVAKKFSDLGYRLYATAGTAKVLQAAGLQAEEVKKIHESADFNTLTLIESGKVNYVISTSAKGRIPTRDSVKIRRKTVEHSIPCLTSLDTANAVANSIESHYSQESIELIDINHMRKEKQKLHFVKMQGCGNDYIYFDCFKQQIDNPNGLSVALSNRRIGIGGEGVVLISASDCADAKMRMFNLDGSEGKMCGNAIRNVGKYLYDNKMVSGQTMTIETLSGIKTLTVTTQHGLVTNVEVDMGKIEFSPDKIPVKMDMDRIVNVPAEIAGESYQITCLSVGNPHCVVFVDDIEKLDVAKLGPKFETDPLFPERVNTEFVRVLDDHTLRMRVWERGSGETWECGTGACAAAVAAIENGYCRRGEEITVKLRAGELKIRYGDDGSVSLYGNAVKVFEGDVEI